MSLGLRLRAPLPDLPNSPDEVLPRIEEWLRRRCEEMCPSARHEVVDSCPTLSCSIHPAAEDFELTLTGPTELVVSANTTTAGPGYHIFLTSLLKELAIELGTSWENPGKDSDEFGDETGYFFTGDEALLKSEMTTWLSALANTFFDGSCRPEDRGIALCMPMNPQFDFEEIAITPLGPRNVDWLKDAAQDGGRGMDFWAWPNPGLDADYYLRRALVRMWSDVRWRAPANENEAHVLAEVADCLKRAYELGPDLDYPWSEWKQVLDLLGEDRSEISLVGSRANKIPSIGYRRGHITTRLPGAWGIRIRGAFSDFEPDEDGDSFALDPPREIWFTAYDRSSAKAESFEAGRERMRKERPDYRIDKDGYIAQAVLTDGKRQSGEAYFVLKSSNLARRSRSVCTILFSDPGDKDWAVETWRSLEPPGPLAS